MVETDHRPGLTPEETELLSQYGEEERRSLESRIASGEPSAYVLGKKFFYRNYFSINADCLIPRPDTERVVDEAIALLPRNGRLADLCTGSGCIALSVLFDRRDATAYACDISEGALNAARNNASALGLADRIVIERRDVLTGASSVEKYDLIVSNPPYLRTSEIEEYPDLAAEPRIALDGGPDGLEFYRSIITLCGGALRNNGAFIFEIGYSQADAIKRLAQLQGYTCVIKKDYGGNDRVAILKRIK